MRAISPMLDLWSHPRGHVGPMWAPYDPRHRSPSPSPSQPPNSAPTWAIWPSWPLYRIAVNRGNGVPWITLMRLAPPPIRTAMLTYVTKDHDHQRAWLGSTGIPWNHIPPFGARAEQPSRARATITECAKLAHRIPPRFGFQEHLGLPNNTLRPRRDRTVGSQVIWT